MEKDIIYSKSFKSWFGDWENDPEHSSKVVDKDGKPLVVYHGSLNLFDSFDFNKGHNVPAVWHTDKLSIAYHWSNTSDIHRNSKKVTEDFESLKSLVKELESKNTPFENVVEEISNFTEENFDTKIESRSHYTSFEDCKKYRLNPEENEGIYYGYDIIYNDGTEIGGNVRKDIHKYYEELLKYVENMIKDSSRDSLSSSYGGFLYKNYLNIRKPLIVDAKDEPYHNIRYRGKYYNTESLAMYAKERGYDGVIVKNVYETDYENKKGTDYIVFNPNQIKSATDNNGNFSRDSDNMYEKILHRNNKWIVTDHTGKKNLGTYDTKEEAEKRLKQVEYFKHKNESNKTMNNYTQFFDKYTEKTVKINNAVYQANLVNAVTSYLKSNGYQVTNNDIATGCEALKYNFGKDSTSIAGNYRKKGMNTDTTRVNNALAKVFPPKPNTVQTVEQQNQTQTNPQINNGTSNPEDPKNTPPQDNPMDDLAGITMLTKSELNAMVNQKIFSKAIDSVIKNKKTGLGVYYLGITGSDSVYDDTKEITSKRNFQRNKGQKK